MSTNTTKLDLLLKEIDDRHVQENFYRLKLYLEQLAVGNTTIIQTPGAGGGSGPEETTDQITKIMDCVAGLTVGSWVYQSLSTNNFAVATTDNNPPIPTIGRVLNKPSSTQCTVVLMGVMDITLGRGRVFLDGSGLASLTPPSTGYLQKIGISFGDGTMFANPEQTRTKRI